MKKVIFFALICLASFSCKKESFQPGQYVAREGQYVVSIRTDNRWIGIFDKTQKGNLVYWSSSGNSLSGDYPDFIYIFDNTVSPHWIKPTGKIVMDCHYDDFKHFTATVKEQLTELNLPTILRFTKDDRPLDTNGDGILDEMQNR